MSATLYPSGVWWTLPRWAHWRRRAWVRAGYAWWMAGQGAWTRGSVVVRRVVARWWRRARARAWGPDHQVSQRAQAPWPGMPVGVGWARTGARVDGRGGVAGGAGDVVVDVVDGVVEGVEVGVAGGLGPG
mgnify:CR=1 FL=1